MFKVGKKFGAAVIAGGLMVSMPLSTHAVVHTLSDGTNSLQFDDATTTITDWTVGGVNHVGSVPFLPLGNLGIVYGIALIPLHIVLGDPVVTTFTDPFDLNIYRLEAVYSGPLPGFGGVLLTMSIDMTGGLDASLVNVGFSMESDVSASLLLTELSNMDLNGTPGGDNLVVGTPQMLSIVDGSTQFQQNWLGTNGVPLADPFFDAGDIAPGDLGAFYAWEFSFVPGTTQTTGELVIGKVLTTNNSVVPEPVTAFLSLLGLGAVAGKLTARKSR